MKCPRCNWTMRHLPNDDIANYICERQNCGFMMTEAYAKELTPEKIEAIKLEEAKTKAYRIQSDAQREANKIILAREEVEREKTVDDVVREHKNIRSITDFT